MQNPEKKDLKENVYQIKRKKLDTTHWYELQLKITITKDYHNRLQ